MRRRRDRDDGVREAGILQHLQRVPGAARLAADDHAAIAHAPELAERVAQPPGGAVPLVGHGVAVEPHHVVARVVERAHVRLRLRPVEVGGAVAVRPDVDAPRGLRPPPDEPGVGSELVADLADERRRRLGRRRRRAGRPDDGQVLGIDGAIPAALLRAVLKRPRPRDLQRAAPGTPPDPAVRADGDGTRHVGVEPASVARAPGRIQAGNGGDVEHGGKPGGLREDRPGKKRHWGEDAAEHGADYKTLRLLLHTPRAIRPGLILGGCRAMRVRDVKKVVLAYSGGLDTSVILRWLQTAYRCEVVTFTADLGQGEELEPARRKAEMFGIREIFVEDLRETFVRDFVFPMFRANALYEGQYLLGTSIARPLIAQRQIEIAEQVGADAVAHGATGKGNDQVRFELSYYALKPDVKVIAPWREWDLTSRQKLIEFAEQNQIPIAKDKRGEAPFSVDANLLHSSSEGKLLEDPGIEADEIVYQRTIRPEDAPDRATVVAIDFERGDPVALDGEALSPATLLARLNQLGHDNGVGRLDLVENRFVGMKSRGVYETPGGTILYAAHRAMETITLDREAAHLKDELMPRYASIVYNGLWFSPERRMLQAAIDASQNSVTGQVRMKLYKGGVTCVGRESPNSLYSLRHVTFEEDEGAYDQFDAQGFIKLNALRLRLGAMAGRRGGAL